MDFIAKLYETDNFTTILTVVIVLLIILFFVILIFGKKDQKLEETKRLQKIDLDGFKEEDKKAVKVEAEVKKEKVVEKEEVKPVDDLEATMTIFKPEIEAALEKEEVKETDTKEMIVSPVQEDDATLDEIESELETGLNNLQKIKNEFKDIEIPEVEIKKEKVKEEKKEEKGANTQVFSSVYVNKSDFAPEEDEDDFDLPTLK